MRDVYLPTATGTLLLAMCLALIAILPASGQTIGPAEQARLAEGEVLISVEPDAQPSVARIVAAIEIAAAPSRVWATMLDCARAPKFIGGLVSCRILQRDPKGLWDVREHRVSWIALFPAVRSVFRSAYVIDQSISFQRVEGDIDILEGDWTLEALRGGAATRLRYAARVGKETVVPGFMIRAAISNDVPKTLRSLREEVLRGTR